MQLYQTWTLQALTGDITTSSFFPSYYIYNYISCTKYYNPTTTNVTSTTNSGGNSTVHTSTRPTETLKIKDVSQLTYMSSTMSLSYDTPSLTSLGSCCNNMELISGLVILSIVMFGLGGVLGGLLTVLWNKWRCSKGICHIV